MGGYNDPEQSFIPSLRDLEQTENDELFLLPLCVCILWRGVKSIFAYSQSQESMVRLFNDEEDAEFNKLDATAKSNWQDENSYLHNVVDFALNDLLDKLETNRKITDAVESVDTGKGYLLKTKLEAIDDGGKPATIITYFPFNEIDRDDVFQALRYYFNTWSHFRDGRPVAN